MSIIAQGNTEIFVFDCKIWHDQFSLSNPRNVTSNPGYYDNQPYFMPDGETFLYSSADEIGTTDVYMYDLRSRSKRRLTYTPEGSEYSPTPTLDKKGFSCIILEQDGTQKLWKYFTNAPIASLVTDVANIGYHTWYNENKLGLFIVGDKNTLHVVDVESGTSKQIDDEIGRSMYRIPGQNKISYVSLRERNKWKIMSIDMESQEISEIIQTLPESQDYTWTADGIILMGDGEKLYKYDPLTDQDWVELADLSKYGLGPFTRVAINPQVSKLAVVVEE
jgi:tricorn protease-like protein